MVRTEPEPEWVTARDAELLPQAGFALYVVRRSRREPPLGGILNPHEPVDALVRRRNDAFPEQRNLRYPQSSLAVL